MTRTFFVLVIFMFSIFIIKEANSDDGNPPVLAGREEVIEVFAGDDFVVDKVGESVKLNGDVTWFKKLKARIVISRGYILRLEFDSDLWNSDNFFHLKMSKDFGSWNWIIMNEPVDELKPYIVYPETILDQLFFEVYVSNKEFLF
jgi:hypothetical protein